MHRFFCQENESNKGENIMATRSLTINAETQFPSTIHTWTVTKSGNQIVAKSSSRAKGKDEYRFPFKEGVLFFYNGNDKKYAYFRSSEFQEFFAKHGISAVKREDPNQTFSVRSHNGGAGHIGYSIRTDGEVREERTGGQYDNVDYEIGNACYDSKYLLHVTGATWVILSTSTHYRDNHSSASVLYTLQRVEELEIPAAERQICRSAFTF
jgi:hypothetical protein